MATHRLEGPTTRTPAGAAALRAARPLGRRLTPVRGLWLMFVAIGAAGAVTYARLPLGQAYHFHDTGLSGAVSRLIAYANYPVALAAIALVWAICRRREAVVATALCAVVFVPGVVRSSDLTAAWSNAPATVGVALALSVTLRAGDDRRWTLTRRRLAPLALLTVCSLPWLLAAAGVYVDDVPFLGFLMSREPTPGHRSLAAVHLGLHDGLLGAELAATALVLSARRLSRELSLYLGLLFVYGLALAVTDAWDEQIVKRGWSNVQLPDVMQPSPSLAWLVLLVGAVAVHVLWFRREQRRCGGTSSP